MNFKSPNSQVIRRQSLWTLVWLALFLVSFFYPSQIAGPQKWLSDQITIVAFALTLFQIGRIFEMAMQRRQNVSPPNSIGAGQQSLLENTSDMAGRATPSWPIREMREYASLEEAQENGWVFTDTYAHFGGKAIPKFAEFQGHKFEYQGLYHDDNSDITIQSNQRVFGKLCYRALTEAPQPSSLPPPSSSEMPAIS